MSVVQLVECPRDAMQGWKRIIPAREKVAYLQALLDTGFHTLDFGSFVSPKAIPQMADTAEVLSQLRVPEHTSLLAIVANERGAETALSQPTHIRYLGFPFSVSPTFQERNTGGSVEEGFKRVSAIQQMCRQEGRELVVYLSMAFGNPYGDPYSTSLVQDWALRLHEAGIHILSLADTVGLATGPDVETLTASLVERLPGCTIGVHLHSTQEGWREKVEGAWNAGCRRFDGALKGIGGCPMAGNDLVGNMDTRWLLQFLAEKEAWPPIDEAALNRSLALAEEVFAS